MKTSLSIRAIAYATALISACALATPHALALATSPESDTGDASIITDLDENQVILRGLRYEKEGLGTPLEIHHPQYRLHPLNTSIEGYGSYRSPGEALRYYNEQYPHDLPYIAEACDMGTLTLSNALEYDDCTEVLYDKWDFPITTQFERVALHISNIADVERNAETRDAVHAFNKNPTRENFEAISAADTEHNYEVLVDNSHHLSLFTRMTQAHHPTIPLKPGVSTYSFRPTILPEVGTPTSALTYARMYAAHPNPQYTNYGDHDCANFLSQILEAGGKQPLIT